MTKFDQRNQRVGQQINIHVGPSPTQPNLMAEGLRLLQSGEYERSLDVFKRLLGVAEKSQVPEIQYYIALASMRGVRPRLLRMSEVKDIERRLEHATVFQNAQDVSHVVLLLAIVKEDYYGLNGLYVKPPTPRELMRQISYITPIHQDEILTHILAPGNFVWEWVRSSH